MALRMASHSLGHCPSPVTNEKLMNTANRLTRLTLFINKLPAAWRPWALSFAIGRVIPFAGTSGVRIQKLTANECVLVLKNKRKVQNHIGSVHAAAMALLAESATGLMTGFSVPDDRIIVIKSMTLTYLKRATGDMTAVDTFTDEEWALVKNTEKGNIEVPIKMTDATGTETVKATMLWAWTPQRKDLAPAKH